MKDYLILLNTIDRIKDFTNTACKFAEDMDIIHGRYVIDAKSIMGIFSIDTSKPVTLRVHSDEKEVLENIEKNIKVFIVDKE